MAESDYVNGPGFGAWSEVLAVLGKFPLDQLRSHSALFKDPAGRHDLGILAEEIVSRRDRCYRGQYP